MKNLDAVLAKLLISLRMEFGESFVGALLGGSAAVRDTYDDIDVCVVLSSDWAQRRRAIIAGATIDFFIENERSIVVSFLSHRRPHLIHMFASGRLLADPSGILARLQRRAVALSDEALFPNADDVFRFVFEPRDMLNRYSAAVEHDEMLARLLLGEFIPLVMRAALRLRSRRLMPTTIMLTALRRIAPDVAARAGAILVSAALPTPHALEALLREAIGERFELVSHNGLKLRTV